MRSNSTSHQCARKSPATAAECREKQTLGEQLTNQALTPCANGKTHGELLLPPGATSQEQIRNVGAGEQQNQPDEHHEELQRCAKFSPKSGGTRRTRAQIQPLIHHMTAFFSGKRGAARGFEVALEVDIQGSVSLTRERCPASSGPSLEATCADSRCPAATG